MTIHNLKGTVGRHSAAPSLPLGQYTFRIAMLAGKRVLAQSVQYVNVFGEVPLQQLFQLSAPQTVNLGSQTFDFVYDTSYYSQPEQAFSVTQSACQSIHITFVNYAGDDPQRTYNSSSTLTISRATGDPSTATGQYGQVVTFDAPLSLNQSWVLNIAALGNNYRSYVNGDAMCDKTSQPVQIG